MKTVIGIVVLGLLVGGIYLLNDLTRTEDGRSRLHVARELEIEVETACPEQRDLIRIVQAPGEVEPFTEVDISSEVVAKIVELPVEEGDIVQAGQLLCRLDDADYRARVLSAKASVARLKAQITQAEADLEKAERDWEHQNKLREAEVTSELETANYRTLLIGARAVVQMRQQELVAAEAALQSTQEDLARTVIKSPIDGVVSQLFAEQGEVVITGTMNNLGTRIMVVSDLSKMQVRCRVDEADAPLVVVTQPARIYLQSDTRSSVAGHVLRVATKGTKAFARDVVTFETLVLITGDDPRVKPGMTANVEIEVARREGTIAIPVQAVVYRKRRDLDEKLVQEFEQRRSAREAATRQNIAEYLKVVFCVEAGKARTRLVETGISDAVRVEILEGVVLADTIATGPYRSLDQLKEGASVKTKEKPATEQQGAPPGAESAAASQPATSQPAASQPATSAPSEGGA